MNPDLSRHVQMQYLRPKQIEERARAFPVVYVPFGPIEWHGFHLPVGTDPLKAHGAMVKTAERFGGIVYPPFYLHNGYDLPHLLPVLTHLFERLKETGFRVIIGVSGHNVEGMNDMINTALAPVTADGRCAGIGLWEVSLSRGDECNTDHAAKWETSDMMFFYGDLVDLSELGDGPINREMYQSKKGERTSGIGGLDPRQNASAEVGRRCIEIASEAIGKKAQELLETLPPEHRAFRLPNINPKYWWVV